MLKVRNVSLRFYQSGLEKTGRNAIACASATDLRCERHSGAEIRVGRNARHGPSEVRTRRRKKGALTPSRRRDNRHGFTTSSMKPYLARTVKLTGSRRALQEPLLGGMVKKQAAAAIQYSSYTCSPPWAGLPISVRLRGSTTKSMCSNGIWPMSTGTSSWTSMTSIVQDRP